MTGPARRLLVVDDDPVARLVLSRILSRLGHEVYVAADVGAGLATAVAEVPELVFSDFELPDGTGDDLLRGIREAGLTMPFVLVTGVVEIEESRSTPGADPTGQQPTVAATLTKPVDSRAVSACLLAALDPSPTR